MAKITTMAADATICVFCGMPVNENYPSSFRVVKQVVFDHEGRPLIPGGDFKYKTKDGDKIVATHVVCGLPDKFLVAETAAPQKTAFETWRDYQQEWSDVRDELERKNPNTVPTAAQIDEEVTRRRTERGEEMPVQAEMFSQMKIRERE